MKSVRFFGIDCNMGLLSSVFRNAAFLQRKLLLISIVVYSVTGTKYVKLQGIDHFSLNFVLF